VNAGVLLQVLLSGLSAGAVLGLIAMGFSLVAGTIRVLHLAHGDVVVAGVFVGVFAILGRTPVNAQLSAPRSLALVAVVLAAATALSWLVAVVLLAPRGAADPLVVVAGGVAAGLLLRALAGIAFPQEGYAIPDPLRLSSLTSEGLVELPGGASIQVRVLAALVLALAVAALVDRLAVRSRFGQALRAIADEPVAAELCGINVRRAVLGAFVVAGLLAGLAGLLDAPSRTASVDDGVVLGLEAIAAALLGGLGSLRGAVGGGLVVGVLQSFAVHAGGAQLQDVAPLALLVVLLAARPQGLRA
jgi:branched-subunit amino acid ABC-type transport system permease component